MDVKKRFVCFYHFIQFSHINLGLHIDLSLPNIEVHLPFGFIRIGMTKNLKQKSLIERHPKIKNKYISIGFQ